MASDSEIFAACYDQISEIISKSISDRGITKENCIILFIKAMEVVELARRKDKELTGPEKADLATTLIKHVLEDLAKHGKIGSALAGEITSIIDSPIGTTLIYGIATLASKGKILINTLIENIQKDGCAKGCRDTCFPRK